MIKALYQKLLGKVFCCPCLLKFPKSQAGKVLKVGLLTSDKGCFQLYISLLDEFGHIILCLFLSFLFHKIKRKTP